ncbi:MAG: Com family DNA-binding transcriptional regulator [Arsenophonus sp. NEOnobi-MAG3]
MPCCGCQRFMPKADAIYIQIKSPRCKAFNEMRVKLLPGGFCLPPHSNKSAL